LDGPNPTRTGLKTIRLKRLETNGFEGIKAKKGQKGVKGAANKFKEDKNKK
jgi:hypothetical protein